MARTPEDRSGNPNRSYNAPWDNVNVYGVNDGDMIRCANCDAMSDDVNDSGLCGDCRS